MKLPDTWDWKKPDWHALIKLRAERLLAVRELAYADPGTWPRLKLFYKDHPIDFLSDWAWTMDPRNAEINLPALIPFAPFPRQEQFVQWVVERWRTREDWMAEKSRDVGVSWLCVGIACHIYLFYPGAVVGFGSRKEELVDDSKDPKALFHKARMLIRMLPRELRPMGYNERQHATYMSIVNPENEAVIVGEAGDNIGRGGRTTLYFMDEAAHIPQAKKVNAALSQTTNCQGDVSTPSGMDNPFAEKRHSGKARVFTFRWQEDPRKDQAWYDKEVAEADDPAHVAQELDIDYSASRSDVWIEGELVRAAMTQDSSRIEPIGAIYFSIDVARYGNAESVFTIRRGRLVYPQIIKRNRDSEDLSGDAIEVIDNMTKLPTQIAIDMIGVGAGVYDRLSRHYAGKIQVIGVDSSGTFKDGSDFNRRARMWRAMKRWLKDVPVSLPNDRKLETQLCTPGHHYRNGRMLIESKDDLLARGVASPDRADSLALTFDTVASDASTDMSWLDEGTAMAA